MAVPPSSSRSPSLSRRSGTPTCSRLQFFRAGACVLAWLAVDETTSGAARTVDLPSDISVQVFEAPEPIPADIGVPLPPDSVAYRLKRKLLGPPLHSDEMEHQRLGKPTALAVFASDNLSSSAYATEEILHVLIPLVGLAAFSLVVPITVAMVVVLGFLILCYRETIKAYPSAGGAYLVTRDNFGIVPAQVAGASLLTDYILTVAVSVVGRHGRAGVGLRRPRAVQGADRALLHRADRLREPAGGEGVREGLRRPHLLLHRQHVRAARARRCGCTSTATCPSSASSSRATSTRPSSTPTRCSTAPGSSACCTPSPPAARRSPASRRSPTACRRSRSPRGSTLGRRS